MQVSPGLVPPRALTATPSPAAPAVDVTGGTGWPAGGQFGATPFVDPAAWRAGSTPRTSPELAPQTFSFQKVAAGSYQAELDFPATVVQLHRYLPVDGGDEGGPVETGRTLFARITCQDGPSG